jgi:ribosome-associated protein
MDDLPVTPTLTIPGAELTWTASRASGPGGQHVNRTNSRVSLRWVPATSAALAALDEPTRAWLLQRLAARLDGQGALQVHVEDARSQLQNRETARARLAEVVRRALERPRARRATRPTRGAVERRLDAKQKHSQKKTDRTRRFDD